MPLSESIWWYRHGIGEVAGNEPVAGDRAARGKLIPSELYHPGRYENMLLLMSWLVLHLGTQAWNLTDTLICGFETPIRSE